MQHIEQAIEQASTRGMAVTIITIHPPDDFGEPDVDDVYANAAKPAQPTQDGQASDGAESQALLKRMREAEQRVHDLSAQNADLQKELQAARAAVSGDASALQAQVAELQSKLANAEEALKNKASSTPFTNGGGADPGAALASFSQYPQTVLGLSEKAQKGVDRVGCQTVGDVRAALAAGDLVAKGKGKGQLAKDQVIEVANKLLGQVPEGGAPPADASQNSDQGGGAREDVPPGHQTPSWTVLLGSARKKEAAAASERAKLSQAAQNLAALRAQQVTPDVQQNIVGWEQAQSNADKMLAMYEGQIATLLYAMGLPHNLKQVRGVNGALEAAGLNHLVNESPQPQPAPVGASS